MKMNLPTLFALFVSLYSGFLLGQELHYGSSLRTITPLEGQFERVTQINSGRVLLADFKLIRRDFTFLREWSESQILSWILENFQYMSNSQVKGGKVNSPLQSTQEQRHAIRPPEYGRAFILPVFSPNGEQFLVDIKGVGTREEPESGRYSTGLLNLYMGLREYYLEKLITAIFENYYPQYKAVGTYAVIDLGFKYTGGIPSFANQRAVSVVRQATVRNYDSRQQGDKIVVSKLPDKLQLEIELALRTFGIRSFSDKRNNEFISIQGTTDGRIIDFGGFRVAKQFNEPIKIRYGNQIYEETLLMEPNHKDFLSKPNPKLALSPIADKISIYLTALAGVSSTKENDKELFLSTVHIAKMYENWFRNEIKKVETRISEASCKKSFN